MPLQLQLKPALRVIMKSADLNFSLYREEEENGKSVLIGSHTTDRTNSKLGQGNFDGHENGRFCAALKNSISEVIKAW
jgi:hypothetical protein